MSKSLLRQRAVEARRAIPPSSLAIMSADVGRNLESLREYREARTLAAYVAKDDEVQTAPILEMAVSSGKTVVVPLVDVPSGSLLFFRVARMDELSPGHFGVLEPKRGPRPVALSETDLVLVPLLAWDSRGHRLGYGKGYFDRALANRGSALAIGLAFECQRVERVPEEPHDVRLDVLVTEKRVLRFGRRVA
jgi:5-formyltetrahydrofolate cyclo-ligase